MKKVVPFIVAVGCTACADEALETYDAIVQSARICTEGDECVMAGGVAGCRCPVAVRRDRESDVNDAARDAACPNENERLACPDFENPRCEDGVCVADAVSR